MCPMNETLSLQKKEKIINASRAGPHRIIFLTTWQTKAKRLPAQDQPGLQREFKGSLYY